MSSVTPVPETKGMAGEELSADDAWRIGQVLRLYGVQRDRPTPTSTAELR